jgi:hypothetical protein
MEGTPPHMMECTVHSDGAPSDHTRHHSPIMCATTTPVAPGNSFSALLVATAVMGFTHAQLVSCWRAIGYARSLPPCLVVRWHMSPVSACRLPDSL